MRLSQIHKLLLYFSTGVLFATGVIWLLMQISPPDPLLDPTFSEKSVFLIRVHGAAAMAFLILFGTMFPLHIPGGLRTKRKLSTGVSVVASSAILIVTGYLLYYSGDDTLRDQSSVFHSVVGVLLFPLLLLHALRKVKSN